MTSISSSYLKPKIYSQTTTDFAKQLQYPYDIEQQSIDNMFLGSNKQQNGLNIDFGIDKSTNKCHQSKPQLGNIENTTCTEGFKDKDKINERPKFMSPKPSRVSSPYDSRTALYGYQPPTSTLTPTIITPSYYNDLSLPNIGNRPVISSRHYEQDIPNVIFTHRQQYVQKHFNCQQPKWTKSCL